MPFFKEVRRSYPNGNVMVVGHNDINRFYIASKLSMEFKNYRRVSQENLSTTCFTLDDNDEILLELLSCRR